MALSSMCTHLFLLSASLLFAPLHAASSSAGFSVELIHRDSPKSPLYDPSSTHFDRAMAAARRSKLTVRQIAARSGLAVFSNTIEANITLDLGEYLMSYEVGSPSFLVHGIFSVGNDFTWTNCEPCTRCYPQAAPLFDPSASATYRNLSCWSDACKMLPTSSDCADDGTCQYHYSFIDESKVDGFLATENVYLRLSEGGVATLPAFPFGCAYQSSGTFPGTTSGIVGLNQGPLSWILHLGSTMGIWKFSYCLPPFDKPEKVAKLNFGDAAVYPTGAAITPLVRNSASYVVNLIEIVVGERSIILPTSTAGNMAVDSRTPLTFLIPTVLEQVVDAVMDLVQFPRSFNESFLVFGACFEDEGQPKGGRYPGMLFNFAGGAIVELTPENAFMKPSAEVVCLAMSGALDKQLLGTQAQQNKVIVYNVGEKMLGIASADCGAA